MEEIILKTVQQFFNSFGRPDFPAAVASCLTEDATYDVEIAQDGQLKSTFYGRHEVLYYLSIANGTYQILHAVPTTFIVSGNQVTVRGAEVARLVRQNQIVQAEWVASLEMKGNLIKKVAMSVHQWIKTARSS